LSKHEIWHPPLYEKQDVAAIQSLERYARTAGLTPRPGEDFTAPSAEQIRRSLDWIIHQACGTYDEPFVPGRPDVRDYLLGRRSVGLAIVKLTKLNIGKVFRGKDDFSEQG
jgi:hypothetical protein